ncbi:MAG: glutaredoxin 3 [Alphaproteobacteria bacterium]
MRQVEIYTRVLCAYCHRAKKLLGAKNVPFVEYDVTMDAEKRREMVARSGGRTTMPQIFVGGEHVGDSEELLRLEREGRLDRILKEAS